MAELKEFVYGRVKEPVWETVVLLGSYLGLIGLGMLSGWLLFPEVEETFTKADVPWWWYWAFLFVGVVAMGLVWRFLYSPHRRARRDYEIGWLESFHDRLKQASNDAETFRLLRSFIDAEEESWK